jgi:hypothetical protein
VKSRDAPKEGTTRHIEIPQNVNREAVEHKEDVEESEVDGELDEVCKESVSYLYSDNARCKVGAERTDDQLQRQDILSLCLPARYLDINLVNVVGIGKGTVKNHLSKGGCCLALADHFIPLSLDFPSPFL